MKTMRRRGICALLALLLFVTAIPAVPLAVSAGSKDIHIPISFGQTKESRERAFASKTDFQITDGGSSWL